MHSLRIREVFIGKVEEASSSTEVRRLDGECWLAGDGLPGDELARRRHPGAADCALLHYPAEHYRHWRKRFPLHKWRPAACGENLSTFGVGEAEICIGDLVRWGEALLEVSQPCLPDYRLAQRWNLAELPPLLQDSGRCGWFYRVRRPGLIDTRAPLQLVQRHYPELSVARLLAWFVHEPLQRSALRQMLACDALGSEWRRIAARRLASGELEDWQPRLYGRASAQPAAEGADHA
ncbi:MOSC domain-containing protein [Pseudomonas sp. AN-1]|uniref:MOSC domain-containing protein n=1 Tax=Pseudomonas sp. AN-1 TaxID=3096605 RepID=UPI002A6A3B1F|nr:MOSC domain-containing protein [Pseudomonas sp. AN-1]WPP45110.1 MOSC domain-containing protein [Pseudomonas sp. AN-1]